MKLTDQLLLGMQKKNIVHHTYSRYVEVEHFKQIRRYGSQQSV